MEEESSSFGIKKIVDCRIGGDGKQIYKVKWTATWEPAENLVTCQHLIDEFWSFVNKAKTNEQVAQQHRKRMKLGMNNNNVMANIDGNIERLSDDNKADVQRLIARANATSVGTAMLVSPSKMLSSSPRQQNNVIAPQMSMQGQHSLNFSAVGNKGNTSTITPAKVKPDNTETKSLSSSSASNTSSLKYLESFDNPYVKLIIVCKICNKEASKSAGQWKVHYLTHVSKEDRPFKCEICHQGFVQKIHLQRHMKKHVKMQPLDPAAAATGISAMSYGEGTNFKTEYSY